MLGVGIVVEAGSAGEFGEMEGVSVGREREAGAVLEAMVIYMSRRA